MKKTLKIINTNQSEEYVVKFKTRDMVTSKSVTISLGDSIITTMTVDNNREYTHKFTTPISSDLLSFDGLSNAKEIYDVMFLSGGNVNNTENVPYFEGMRSVGQDDENGHGIEIMSNGYLIESGESKEGEFITYDSTKSNDLIEITEIWGNTVQDEENLEDIQSVGELYVDDEGEPILDDLGREQYKIELESCNTINLINRDDYTMLNNNEMIFNQIIDSRINKIFTYKSHSGYNSWVKPFQVDSEGNTIVGGYKLNKQSIVGSDGFNRYTFEVPYNVEYFKLQISHPHFEEQLSIGTYDHPLEDYKPLQTNKTTILLPCQLQKVKNVYDRLYWDSEKCKYVIEKNIGDMYLKNCSKIIKNSNGGNSNDIVTMFGATLNNRGLQEKNVNIKSSHTNSFRVGSEQEREFLWTINTSEIYFTVYNTKLPTYDVDGLLKYNTTANIRFIYEVQTPLLIETNITEKIQLPCYEDKTHIFLNSAVDTTIRTDHVIIKGNTSKYSKKEILLNEPLRGLPNGVKDRFVKIGGKWFIERNCTSLIIEGNIDCQLQSINDEGIANFKLNIINCPNKLSSVISDKFVSQSTMIANTTSEGIYSNGGIYIRIHSSKCDNVETFIEWTQKNPITIIYELSSPTYEPLETNPEFTTYVNTTHISNNSLIPCNMKVKNSGYDVIIKPSTLYTIALDTNKSGTIGVDLGGAKGTTTNNVLTLTTPSTLTDDSLRLYGKGIKGSKVMILEGDKTGWIPSFFEGMKSCFEDKVQEDGSYKMEILSNNENLFDLNGFAELNNFKIVTHNGKQAIKIDTPKAYKNIYLKSPICIKGGETYKFSGYMAKVDYPTDNSEYLGIVLVCNNGKSINLGHNYIDTSTEWKHIDKTFSSNDSCQIVAIQFFSYRLAVNFLLDIDTIRICKKGMENITKHQSNKIQFLSIKPLRGVGDVKDRFVFKDGKLMIERNCGTGSLDGTSNTYHCWNNNVNDMVCGYIYYNEHKPAITNIKQYGEVVATGLPNNVGGHIGKVEGFRNTVYFAYSIHKSRLGIDDINAGIPNQGIVKQYFTKNPLYFTYQLAEPTYEEIPFELQKIILEGYENGTLFIDTNIPPTVTTTYAGEIPMVSAIKTNKTDVVSNTNDINDNIIPYLMDMDFRIVLLQLENGIENISMTRLFGGAYEMLKRDIQSKRYSIEEYKYRLDAYLSANKITEKEYVELGEMLNE